VFVSRRRVISTVLTVLARHRPVVAGGTAGRLLILGGTGFLGSHLVEVALSRGMAVTIFHGGVTRRRLSPAVERLYGDRDGHLRALEGTRCWDAVVDTCGYVPRVVGASARLLASRVGQYVFVSSIAVYGSTPPPEGPDESAPVATMADPRNEDVPRHYGALKVLCERAVESVLPGRTTSIRPGLLAGPHDNTDRFTYWPARFERGGEVLAPGDGGDPFQVIDARDLASWIIHCVENRILGVFNAVGPAQPMTWREMLAAVAQGTGTKPSLRWVAAPLLEGRIGSEDIPGWFPRQSAGVGIARVQGGKAIEAGLRLRSVEETARDTLAWWKAERARTRARPRSGLPPRREATLLTTLSSRP
jgi:2'-hydroxyisoflavone reductase